ncbi:MAG: DUF1566 domain-containing protein [Spirochaetaceae bacterium]|jgi:hypothetical protein|nr:DUF1566 domain-containing protein [Spirochaetaceae bacterium]
MMKAYFYSLLFTTILLFSWVLVGCEPLEGYVLEPAGGYVFYDKGSYSDGWRYLECALEDVGGDVVSWEQAQTACEAYTYGRYKDWRLPTRAELSALYNNLHKKGIGNFAGKYWSSEQREEYKGNKAYYFDFDDGSIHTAESSSYRVRPVRQF